MLQINRKLNSKGRNVTLRTNVTYNDNKSKSLSTSNVHLYQIKIVQELIRYTKQIDII